MIVAVPVLVFVNRGRFFYRLLPGQWRRGEKKNLLLLFRCPSSGPLVRGEAAFVQAAEKEGWINQKFETQEAALALAWGYLDSADVAAVEALLGRVLAMLWLGLSPPGLRPGLAAHAALFACGNWWRLTRGA